MSVELSGRCGLYCGYCSIYRAYKDSPRLREEIAKRFSCKLEDVKCDGCRSVDGYIWCVESKWGKNCKVLACLDEKGLTYCDECEEYAICEKFNDVAKESLEWINVDIRGNLRRIREVGVDQWLKEQDKKWRCSSCGNPSINSVEVDYCHWCGKRFR